MGFLTVNTKFRSRPISGFVSKDQKLKARTTRSASPQLSALESKDVCRSAASMNSLPQEILEDIFALSGNLEFPQASLVLARRLSRTRSLEKKMIRAQLVEDKTLPVSVVNWSFVGTDLLKDLEVEQFIDIKGSRTPMLPFKMEQEMISIAKEEEDLHSISRPDIRLVDLAAYMVKCGCVVENSYRMYDVFIKMDYANTVLELCRSRQRADKRHVCSALVAGMKDLAWRLFEVCPELNHLEFDRLAQFVQSQSRRASNSDNAGHTLAQELSTSEQFQ